MGDQGSDVYNQTTEPVKSKKCFVVPTEILSTLRCLLKVAEVLLSFLAFVLEEVVTSCMNCTALYFFEFVSCTAFLFTLLLLILLATPLHLRVGIDCWAKVDFVYTLIIAVLFVLASITFAVKNEGTSMEQSAAAFGFLATVVFFVDMVMFLKTKGFPFKRSDKAAQSGDATPPTPEAAPLNAVSNGTAE